MEKGIGTGKAAVVSVVVVALLLCIGTLGIGRTFSGAEADPEPDEEPTAAEEQADVQSVTVGAVSFEVPADWELTEEATADELGFDITMATSKEEDAFVYAVSPYTLSEWGGVDAATESLVASWELDDSTLVESTDEAGAVYQLFDYVTTDEDSGESMEGYCLIIYSGDTISMLTITALGTVAEDYADTLEAIVESAAPLDPEEPVEVDEADASGDYSIVEILGNMPSFDEQTASGTGSAAIELPITGDPLLLTVTAKGDGDIAVYTLDEDGEVLETLASATDSYKGTLTTYASFAEATSIGITCDGDWTITYKPMSAMEELENGAAYEGDDVLYIDTDELATISVTNAGTGSFAIRAVGIEDADILVNDSGDYSGEVEWGEAQSFVIVASDGEWSISW